VIASIGLALALLPGGAGVASDYQQVLQVYEREGGTHRQRAQRRPRA
jgi:hypothetical protein